jgi:hypothetical protein
MFSTENPIRGGVPCFRVEDRSSTPRFMVIRRSVPFLHWPVFIREINRYKWKQIPVNAQDIPFGNNPEPDNQPYWILLRFKQLHNEQALPNLILAEMINDAPAYDNLLKSSDERQ